MISITIVVENTENCIDEICEEILTVAKKNWEYFELLIVDNRSQDRTVERIRALQKKQPNIRLIVLSRTYDENIAVSAGLDQSIGDYVVLMNPLFDPPEMIPALVAAATDGADVVIAERTHREDSGWWHNFFAISFYRIISRISGLNFSPHASDFRVLSRRAVNSITAIKSKVRYIKYMNALVGFTQTTLPYERVYRKNAPATRPSFLHNVSTAIAVIVSHSVLPLRLASLFGLIASFLNVLFICYVFVVSLLKENVAEGWLTTSLVNSGMFLVLFLILTILSEYIARILMESKDQPLYFIAEEHNSSFLRKLKDTINVV